MEASMKRCAIFGGAGFLGKHIISRLSSTNRELICIDRFQSEAPKLPATCSFIHVSEEQAFFHEVLKGVDEVVDLAYSSVPKTSYEDPINDIFQNLPRIVKLCRAAVVNRVSKVVLFSSGGTIYGQTPSLPIGEDHPTNPTSPYGITKLAIEKYAHMYYVTEGLPVICLRPGNAYGEGQIPFRGQGFIATAIASIINGLPVDVFGESGTIRDYIHASEIAYALENVLDTGKPGGIYNVGTGIGTSNMDILRYIRPMATAEGLDVQIQIKPSRSFDVTANVLDISRIYQDIGWKPSISIEEGLASTWSWYLANRDEWGK
jgi:UDP-glucose 4-epimerase